MNAYEEAVLAVHDQLKKELEAQGVALSSKVQVEVISPQILKRLEDSGEVRPSEDPLKDTEDILRKLRAEGYC